MLCTFRLTLVLSLSMLSACGSRTGLRFDASVLDVPRSDVADAIDASDVDVVRGTDVLAPFDVADPCDQGGEGCAFPDGTRVGFGESVMHGCIRCGCSENGGLTCEDTCPHPEDDAGGTLSLHCTFPDGARVIYASWAQVGSVWCYCDVGGGAHCSSPSCGTTVVSEPQVLGPASACNALPLEQAPRPMPLSGQGALWGGQIPPVGRYVLTTVFSGGQPLARSQPAMIDVRADNTLEIARFTADATSVDRATYEMQAGTYELTLWERCPLDLRNRVVMVPDGGTVVIPGRPLTMRWTGTTTIDIYSSETSAPHIFRYERF